MKFCPVCEAKLKSGAGGLSCPKCEYVEGPAAKEPGAQGAVARDDGGPGQGGLDVLDPDEEGTTSVLPTIKIGCEKCGNDEAVWWMLQTRSADEPTTQFYRCTKCRYTWRDYS